MDKNNAVRNQKVFITLDSVLELQERLRHEEAGYIAARKVWQDTPTTVGCEGEKRESSRTMAVWQARVDALSGVVKLFDLPIETKINRG